METEALKRHRKRQKRELHQASNDAEPISDGDDDTDSDEEEERQHNIASRAKQLNLTLQTLDLVDRLWAAVLRGNLINLPVRSAMPRTPSQSRQTRQTQPQRPALTVMLRLATRKYRVSVNSTSSLVPSPAIDGRFASSASASASNAPKRSLPIHGGRGNRTVGVTDQIRLRNIAISSRDKLFSWMRSELDAPAPPTMQEDDVAQDEPRDNTVEGALEIKQDPDVGDDPTGDDEDPDFEDVAIGEQPPKEEEGYDAAEDTQEHQHYQDLFDRKIDPDEDDDEEDEDPPAKVEVQLKASRHRSWEHPSSARWRLSPPTMPTSKGSERLIRIQHKSMSLALTGYQANDHAHQAQTEKPTQTARWQRQDESFRMGSINFSLSDAIGQWGTLPLLVSSQRPYGRSAIFPTSPSAEARPTSLRVSRPSLGADEQEPADDR